MELAGFWLKQDGPVTTNRRFLGSTEPKSLKGLDHLRPGILQQQKFLQSPQPFHRLQYPSLQQEQLLLQGQQTYDVIISNVGSAMPGTDTDMLIKMIVSEA